jgi:hypothetical protein
VRGIRQFKCDFYTHECDGPTYECEKDIRECEKTLKRVRKHVRVKKHTHECGFDTHEYEKDTYECLFHIHTDECDFNAFSLHFYWVLTYRLYTLISVFFTLMKNTLMSLKKKLFHII